MADPDRTLPLVHRPPLLPPRANPGHPENPALPNPGPTYFVSRKQSRRIPPQDLKKNPDGRMTLRIASGDTWESLARTHGQTIDELKLTNPHAAQRELKPGDEITILGRERLDRLRAPNRTISL